MKNWIMLIGSGVVLLTGCYCEKYVRHSSVRDLRGNKTFTICHQPRGMKDGKSVLLTAYAGDPLYTAFQFGKSDTNRIISCTAFDSKGTYGFQLKRYLILGSFPGPLLGSGINYSQNTLHASYYTVMHQVPERQHYEIRQRRISMPIELVTIIRHRSMGYLSVQPGVEWTKRKIQSEFVPFNVEEKKYSGKFNCRIAYGFQFYLRRTFALHLEIGYGGGSFLQAGISWWGF